MIQALTQPMTFAQFLEWKSDKGLCELHEGEIIEMQPTGKHEEIGAFLARKFNFEIERLDLPLLIPKQALIKPAFKQSGYFPDVLVLNRHNLSSENMWEKASTVSLGNSIPLVVEVVSTNWGDDYALKLEDYELIGIGEYWIVDYLALGGRRFIGNPKQPTISVYKLVENEYQVAQYRGNEVINSSVFPGLKLTANQIFRVGLS